MLAELQVGLGLLLLAALEETVKRGATRRAVSLRSVNECKISADDQSSSGQSSVTMSS